MGRVELPYVHSFRDRHNHWRYYYRRFGRRVPLDPKNLAADYARVHAQHEKQTKTTQAGTFGELVETYLASADFSRNLRDSTKTEYRRHIEAARVGREHVPLKGITKRVLLAYRDTMADRPASANSAMRVLRTLFNFGIERGLVKENPAKGIKPLNTNSDGWPPWPEPILAKFAAESKGAARMAFFLGLYTGQRRGDILKMKRDAIKDGGILVKQLKTGAELWVPIHPILAQELVPDKFLSLFLVHRENGGPYTDEGFGTIWNREQNRLDCKWPFHGLRKNATQALFELGCTPQQVQAITGHETLEMISHYGKGANQKRMAQEVQKKWVTTLPDVG